MSFDLGRKAVLITVQAVVTAGMSGAVSAQQFPPYANVDGETQQSSILILPQHRPPSPPTDVHSRIQPNPAPVALMEGYGIGPQGSQRDSLESTLNKCRHDLLAAKRQDKTRLDSPHYNGNDLYGGQQHLHRMICSAYLLGIQDGINGVADR